MGYMCHHAIIVTTFSRDYSDAAYAKACDVFDLISGPLRPDMSAMVFAPQQTPVNGEWTLFIGPDGSKEGWDVSEHGDALRAWFVDWLETQRFEDGSSPYRWVVVQYGDDDGDNRIVISDRVATGEGAP